MKIYYKILNPSNYEWSIPHEQCYGILSRFSKKGRLVHLHVREKGTHAIPGSFTHSPFAFDRDDIMIIEKEETLTNGL